MPVPVDFETILTNAGITPEAFITLGYSPNDKTRNDFWHGITRNLIALDNTGGIEPTFGSGSTLDSVLETIDAARVDAETTRINDLKDNQYAKRFKALQNDSKNALATNLNTAETALSIGFIDVAIGELWEFNNATLVPSSIVVEESFLNQKIETLRTNSAPVVPSYQSDHKITFDIVFPSIDALNSVNGFRGLYAQCKMLPFITLESPILSAIFVNKVVTPKIIKAVNKDMLKDIDFAAEIHNIAKDARVSFTEAIELLKTQDPLLDTVIDDISNKIHQNIYTNKDNIDNQNFIEDIVTEAASDISFAIPVVFHGVTIQTMPKHPGTVLTRWTFSRTHNSSFYNGQVLFKDQAGNPTLDIKQCQFMLKYFRQLLDQNKSGNQYLKPIVRDESGKTIKSDDPDFEWEDVVGNQNTLDIPEFIDSQVTIRMRHKIATLPIIGSIYPMSQYMGRHNVEAHIVYSTTSLNAVQKFNQLKSEIIAEGRKGFIKSNAITIHHPLLELIGVNRFAINQISIESNIDNPNLYQITLNIIENTVDARTTETIEVEKPDFPKKAFRAVMKYLYRAYRIIYKYGILADPTERRRRLNDIVHNLKQPKSRNSLPELYELLNSPPKRRAIETIIELLFSREGLLGSIDGRYGPVAAGIFRRLYQIQDNGLPYASNASLDYQSLYERLVNIKEHGFRSVEKIQSDLLTSTGTFNETVVITGISAPLARFKNFSLLNTTVQASPGNIYDLSAAVVERANPFARPLKLGNKLYGKSPMPEAMWDAITDVLIINERDHSVQKLWTTEQIRYAYMLIYGIITHDSASRFVDIPDPEGELPTAVFPRELLNDGFDSLTQVKPTSNTRGVQLDSNYPDMMLPTYAELFSEPDENGVPQLTIVDGNELWTRFSPTYAELGIEPPFTIDNAIQTIKTSRSQLARTVTDQVEPSVFYYHKNIKEELEKVLDQNINTPSTDQVITDEHVIALPYTMAEIRQKAGEDYKTNLGDWFYSQILRTRERLPDEKLNDARNKYHDLRDRKKDGTIFFISAEGQDVAFLTQAEGDEPRVHHTTGGKPTYRTTSTGPTYDILSKEHSNQLVNSVLDHVEDFSMSMARAYPTIRVYFIEEDRESYLFTDDFYGYSSIISCDITTDINDAAVATLSLSNYSGVLSEDEFVTPSRLDTKNGIADDEGEPFFAKIKLQPGTHIQIRMGYTTSRDLLPVVFNGQIAEVQPGQIVTIVAQGFKTELFNEIGFFQEKYSFTKDDRPNFRAVMNKIIDKGGDMPHLGRKMKILPGTLNTEKVQQNLNRIFGGQQSSGLFHLGLGGQAGLWQQLFGTEIVDVGRNIYYSTPSYMSEEWITTTKSSWDALKEVTRFIPNYIVSVVPYDADATLFVGDPAQVYQYRSGSFSERKNYKYFSTALQSRANKALDKELIDNFIKSDFYAIPPSSINKNHDKTYLGRLLIDQKESVITGLTPRRYTQASRLDLKVIPPSDTIDLSPKWQQLGRIHPDLQRYLFAKFFGFRFSGLPWPGGMEGRWQEWARYVMLKLSDNGQKLNHIGQFVLSASADNSNALTSQADFIGYFSGKVKSIKDLPNDIVDATGFASANIQDDTLIGNHIVNSLRSFRVFIDVFSNWLQNQESNGQFDRKKLSNSLRNLRAAGLPPGYKTFRDYHIVTSDSDIIQNNIIVSESEMWNAVRMITTAGVQGWYESWAALKFAARGIIEENVGDNLVKLSENQEKVMFPTVDGVNFRGEKPGAKDIVKTFEEPNAGGNKTMATWALSARLAEGLQKMYRGNLVIVGRKIKPHDVITIVDEENEMYGSFVVERATHHFNTESGWVTTIVPRAHTSVNSPLAMNQMSFISKVAAFLASDTFNTLMWIITGVSLLTGVGGVLAGGAQLLRQGLIAGTRKGAAAVLRKVSNRVLRKRMIQQIGKFQNISKMTGVNMLRRSARQTIGSFTTTATGFTGIAANMAAIPIATAAGVFDVFSRFNINDANMPVFVHLLTYKFSPFSAGITPKQDELNDLAERFFRMLHDAKKAVAKLGKGHTDPIKAAESYRQNILQIKER